MGLGLFIFIGKILGVGTSIQKAIMALASALLSRDLKSESRTIQYLLGKEIRAVKDIKSAIAGLLNGKITETGGSCQ